MNTPPQEPMLVGTGSQYRVEEAGYEVAGQYYCVASICEQGA